MSVCKLFLQNVCLSNTLFLCGRQQACGYVEFLSIASPTARQKNVSKWRAPLAKFETFFTRARIQSELLCSFCVLNIYCYAYLRKNSKSLEVRIQCLQVWPLFQNHSEECVQIQKVPDAQRNKSGLILLFLNRVYPKRIKKPINLKKINARTISKFAQTFSKMTSCEEVRIK